MDDVRSLTSELLVAVDAQAPRLLLGITGPPGAGKSTLAHSLAATVVEQRGSGAAAVAPLDGFHLSNKTLDSLSLRSVKGAPETFDAAGFVESLRRLRDEPRASLRWPDFNRRAEETVPNAISIGSDVKLVIAEGNYLLLDRPPWHEVRSLLDQIWYLDVPSDALRRRLIERQVAHGWSLEDSVLHVDESDLRNAELVARTKELADRTLRAFSASDLTARVSPPR